MQNWTNRRPGSRCYAWWYPDKILHVPDPLDPPVFENEAAYLERHKLLTDTEREPLPADAFEPVRYGRDNEHIT